jgi:hypothetical protein
MLDMIIYVRYVFMPEEDHVKLRVAWFNKKGMDINAEETVKISKSEFSNWYEWEKKR